MKMRKANNGTLILLFLEVKLLVLCSVFFSVILDPRNTQINSQELLAKTEFSSDFVSVTLLYRFLGDTFILHLSKCRALHEVKKRRQKNGEKSHLCNDQTLTLSLKTTTDSAALLCWENESQFTNVHSIPKTERGQTGEKGKSQNTEKKYLTLATQ